MEHAFSRFLDASGCRSQGELAGMLGVRLTLVIDVKKRGQIPEEWLRRLRSVRGVNPQWVLTGEGQKYMDNHGPWIQEALREEPACEGLRGYSSKALAAELLRRAALYDEARGTEGQENGVDSGTRRDGPPGGARSLDL